MVAMSLENGSPGWWLHFLGWKLDNRRSRLDLLARYDEGDHPLPEGDERCREQFKKFQKSARTNFMSLVRGSVSGRMRLIGVRTGIGGDEAADEEAWKIWQRNHLDADSGLVHDAALTFGTAYVMVGATEDGSPVITPEDPRFVICEIDPVDRRTVRAALKTWVDDVAGKRFAVLYLPDKIYYFEAESTRSPFINLNKPDHERLGRSDWTESQEAKDNPWDVVPVVPFVNRRRIDGTGFGEFEDLIDIQTRIDSQVLDRLVIAKLQAYRQRWIKGLPTEDENGNPIDLPFVPGADMLWAVEDFEGVEFGEFEQVNLTPILEAIKSDVKDLVNLASLPPHYVAGDIINASADALAAAETGLVEKVRARMRAFGESWERVLRLAFLIAGDKTRADSMDDAEILWADPERKSIAQLYDAAVKAKDAGVPWRQRMIDLGKTPQEIDRMESERASDALLEASMAASVAAATRPQGQPQPGQDSQPTSTPAGVSDGDQ